MRLRRLRNPFAILNDNSRKEFRIISRARFSIVAEARIPCSSRIEIRWSFGSICSRALRRSCVGHFRPVAGSYPKGCVFDVMKRRKNDESFGARSTQRHRSSEVSAQPSRSARKRCCPSNKSKPAPSIGFPSKRLASPVTFRVTRQNMPIGNPRRTESQRSMICFAFQTAERWTGGSPSGLSTADAEPDRVHPKLPPCARQRRNHRASVDPA